MMILHSKKDYNYYYRFLFFGLLPLIIFGFIKNGIFLKKETTDLFIILRPIIYFFINFILGFILDLIFNKKIIGKYTLFLVLLYMIISINTPLWLYLAGDVILFLLLFKDYYMFNKLCLVKILNAIGLILIHKHTYENVMESTGRYALSFLDLIFKRQIGGISTGNLILVGVLLIYLLFNIYYKKNTTITSVICFVITLLVLSFVKDNNSYLKLLINSTALFELIMIAPLCNYSSYTGKGEIIYGFLLGLISALLMLTKYPYEAATLTILILSPTRILLDKIFALDIK